MKNPLFVESEKGLEGRIIEKCELYGSQLLLRFTDGSYTSIEAVSGYDGCDPDLEFAEPMGRELVVLGIKTEEEYKEERRVVDEINEKRWEDERRQKYEALRKEFEGK